MSEVSVSEMLQIEHFHIFLFLFFRCCTRSSDGVDSKSYKCRSTGSRSRCSVSNWIQNWGFQGTLCLKIWGFFFKSGGTNNFWLHLSKGCSIFKFSTISMFIDCCCTVFYFVRVILVVSESCTSNVLYADIKEIVNKNIRH